MQFKLPCKESKENKYYNYRAIWILKLPSNVLASILFPVYYYTVQSPNFLDSN